MRNRPEQKSPGLARNINLHQKSSPGRFRLRAPEKRKRQNRTEPLFFCWSPKAERFEKKGPSKQRLTATVAPASSGACGRATRASGNDHTTCSKGRTSHSSTTVLGGCRTARGSCTPGQGLPEANRRTLGKSPNSDAFTSWPRGFSRLNQTPNFAMFPGLDRLGWAN